VGPFVVARTPGRRRRGSTSCPSSQAPVPGRGGSDTGWCADPAAPNDSGAASSPAVV
jgi:hypothetical protein